MASLTLLFVAFITVGVSSSVADAQLVQFVISGTVPCSNGTAVITSTTPVFANATVQLVCNNNVTSSAVTNINGVFAMVLNPFASLLSTLNACKLVVKNPLSNCNSTLPSTGNLQAPLQLNSGGLLGGIVGGIVNLIPTLFSLIN